MGILSVIFTLPVIALLGIGIVAWFVWLSFHLRRGDRSGAARLRESAPWIADFPEMQQTITRGQAASERLLYASLAAKRRPTDPDTLDELRRARLAALTWGGNPDPVSTASARTSGDTVASGPEDTQPFPAITDETVTINGQARRTEPIPEAG